MKIMFLLIIASIVVAVAFLVAFVVSVRNGQYDDTYSPGHRILFDGKGDPPRAKHET